MSENTFTYERKYDSILMNEEVEI